MKTLAKDELYQNLSDFLKAKGIELTDGSYARGIQKSCELLAEAINRGQNGLHSARTKVDKKLDRMRQVIHEKTAPKPPRTSAAPQPPAPAPALAPAEPAPKAEPKKPRAQKAKRPGKARGKA